MSLSSRFFIAAALLSLSLFAVAGCRASIPFESPYSDDLPDVLREGTLEEIAQLVSERTKEHPFLVRQGRIVLETEEGKMWFEGNLLVRDEPPAVRLRGSRVPIGTLFEVAVSGPDAWVYLNREKQLFIGSPEELRRQTGVAGAVSLQEVVSSILVYQDLQERLSQPGVWRVLPRRDEVFLAQETPLGRQLAWRIRRSDGLIREFVTFDSLGNAELRVTSESWELEDDEPLPGQFVAEVANGAVELTMRLGDYKLGQPLADAVFDRTPSGAREIYLLSDLVNRESVVPIGEEPPEEE